MPGSTSESPILADAQEVRRRAPLVPLVVCVLLVLAVPASSGLLRLLDLSSVTSFVLVLGLIPLLGWAYFTKSMGSGVLRLAGNLPEYSLGLLAVWCALSVLWSGQSSTSMSAIQPVYLVSILCFTLAGRLSSGHLSIVARAWVLLAAAMSIHAIAQFCGLEPLFESEFLGQRGGSILPHPNVLGGHLAITLPLVSVAYPDAGKQSSSLRYGMAAVIVLGIIATLSRSALLAMAVSMPLLWWFTNKTIPRREAVEGRARRIAPFVFLLGVGIALWGMLLLSVEAEQGRFFSFLGLSGSTRLGLWAAAGKMLADAPVLGHGYGSFPLLVPAYRPDSLIELYPEGSVFFKTAHSDYFQQMAETGLIGLALLLGLFFFLAKRTTKGLRDSDSAQAKGTSACVIAALAALMIHSSLNSSLRFTVLLFDLALLVVLSRASVDTQTLRRQPGLPQPNRWVRSVGFLLLAGVLAFSLYHSGTRALSTAFYDLGSHYCHDDQGELADPQLRRSLELDSRNIEARYLVASRHFTKADYSSAYREYLRVWQEAPYFANVLFNLGICAWNLGQPDLARSWFVRSHTLNPYREQTLQALQLTEEEPLAAEQQ